MPRTLPRVIVTATADFPVDLAPVRARLEGRARVQPLPLPFRPLAPEEEAAWGRRLAPAAGVLVRPGYITRGLLERMSRLRVVAVHGAGVDQVDVAACTERGVWVTNAPGANATAVAELTVALMLSLLRNIPAVAARVRSERLWGEARHLGGELRGKTLGLVGIGQVGRKVAALARAFGMRVVACDPALPAAEVRRRGARPLPFGRLLEESDLLSLHAPLTPETHHMVDADALRRMKRGAYLVNCARGPLVDERALHRALASGRLAGAALDVMEGEPPDPASPLFSLPNVILTPHMAGSTRESLRAIAATNAEDIARVLAGRRPLRPVNRVR